MRLNVEKKDGSFLAGLRNHRKMLFNSCQYIHLFLVDVALTKNSLSGKGDGVTEARGGDEDSDCVISKKIRTLSTAKNLLGETKDGAAMDGKGEKNRWPSSSAE